MIPPVFTLGKLPLNHIEMTIITAAVAAQAYTADCAGTFIGASSCSEFYGRQGMLQGYVNMLVFYIPTFSPGYDPAYMKSS